MSNRLIEQEIIFETITGSVAYGTNTPESDIDTRGVAIRNDKGYYFGFLKKFEQQEGMAGDDTVIYDIRKAFSLIADCNPNMLDFLFTEERFHKKITPYWQRVIDNRDKFLSKRARYTYTGYAYAQLNRIKTSRNWLLNPPTKQPERLDYGLPDVKLISTTDMGAFQWIMVHLLKDSMDLLNFTETTKKELMDANWIGLVQRKGLSEEALQIAQRLTGASDGWMDAMRKEQAYAQAKRGWDAYQGWKAGRNKKRAVLEEQYGYDTKHASHLVRLMRMGKEILETGKVQVFRPDRQELLAIRNGAWTYDQIEEYAETMEQEMAKVSEASKLPKEPDRPYLDNLCCSIVEEYLNGRNY